MCVWTAVSLPVLALLLLPLKQVWHTFQIQLCTAQEDWPSNKRRNTCDGLRFYIYRLPAMPDPSGGYFPCTSDGLPSMPCTMVQLNRTNGYSYSQVCSQSQNDFMGERFVLDAALVSRSSDVSGEETDMASLPVFITWQFTIEMLWSQRIARDCRTSNPQEADLFLVPMPNTWMRSSKPGFGQYPEEKWAPTVKQYIADVKVLLASSPQWKRCGGCDHIMLAGRIWKEFISPHPFSYEQPFWHNVTQLTIDRWNPYGDPMPNVFGVPYPTFLHPSSKAETDGWISFVASRSRPNMMTLIAGPRHHRNALIGSCIGSDLCNYTNCDGWEPGKAYTAHYVPSYLSSTFCFQPQGDSPTRRGLFDSLLCGCIPIIFDKKSADYAWYFPPETMSQTLLIADDFQDAERKIRAMSPDELTRRFAKVLSLIPSLVYSANGADDAIQVALSSLRKARPEIFMRQGRTV
eukprot:gnl/TRDRNA2_/TRDRNA2_126705_c0_seq3.p1 gnl/TRDRNA2_/TRDRNA2_126705_c0~~gnl/TRDRNA2_/TRDRNA2_126705_c0_seq3.p1  ORF type:complete len:461 (+),score=35.65 gnl/TRDRNA2_/TRDRNA2_126705_c0_seq3:159-1541(+)